MEAFLEETDYKFDKVSTDRTMLVQHRGRTVPTLSILSKFANIVNTVDAVIAVNTVSIKNL